MCEDLGGRGRIGYRPNDCNYAIAELYKDGQRKRFKVSHLVAAAFCKNYDPAKHVHHINRKRNDDRAVNLLPCTPAEHKVIHALYNALFNNIPLLAELLTPIIHCNINLLLYRRYDMADVYATFSPILRRFIVSPQD